MRKRNDIMRTERRHEMKKLTVILMFVVCAQVAYGLVDIEKIRTQFQTAKMYGASARHDADLKRTKESSVMRPRGDGTVSKRRERCSEDGGVWRSVKILAHNHRKFWYNTYRTPRWVDNRPLSFGNAVQGSDRKVWGPCLFLGQCNDEEAYDSLY